MAVIRAMLESVVRRSKMEETAANGMVRCCGRQVDEGHIAASLKIA